MMVYVLSGRLASSLGGTAEVIDFCPSIFTGGKGLFLYEFLISEVYGLFAFRIIYKNVNFRR